ncbi:UDP-N-acetylglucosamine--N-acetylmuramyl-(pentapeptide) pyrophosphoryl-undecaprenol N-acetylglucosamine transferase [Geobacillus sp. BCO2]|nr:UDP-N-acetylglucosamine--N-acetylmuramyl-(pentapeptide) pyrophosphoryl-undecaprenol N-acetylglucosamine transferase [Geobacillus sp. BCO2]
MPFATKICLTFPETKQYVNADKAVYVGAVVREELKDGNAEQGGRCASSTEKTGLAGDGRQLGSKTLNDALRANLSTLLAEFDIIHICGKGNIDRSLEGQNGYKQFEYVNEELPHLLALADIVVSRAGANAIFELLALRKPMLLIPLSKAASRGDQILKRPLV